MKEIVKTKSFWAGIIAIITGIGIIVAEKDYTTGVQTILGGISVLFLRDAVAKNTAGK